jgi:hypothetical protein
VWFLLLWCAPLAQDCCTASEEPEWQRKSALCTFNLHTLACRGIDQVKERGFAGNNLELLLG